MRARPSLKEAADTLCVCGDYAEDDWRRYHAEKAARRRHKIALRNVRRVLEKRGMCTKCSCAPDQVLKDTYLNLIKGETAATISLASLKRSSTKRRKAEKPTLDSLMGRSFFLYVLEDEHDIPNRYHGCLFPTYFEENVDRCSICDRLTADQRTCTHCEEKNLFYRRPSVLCGECFDRTRICRFCESDIEYSDYDSDEDHVETPDAAVDYKMPNLDDVTAFVYKWFHDFKHVICCATFDNGKPVRWWTCRPFSEEWTYHTAEVSVKSAV